MFHFHNILKNLTFQRHLKALVWSKGLIVAKSLQLGDNCIQIFIWGVILLDIQSEIEFYGDA